MQAITVTDTSTGAATTVRGRGLVDCLERAILWLGGNYVEVKR